MNCYKFYPMRFTDGIFNEIDATYVIHLEGNGRLNKIKEQLTRYHPTNQVYILFNKGYKKCKKSPNITIPPLDLVDAFLTCFKHANNQNYKNILILEDDFMFSDAVFQGAPNIDQFLRDNKGPYVYHLGIVPYLQTPTKATIKNKITGKDGNTWNALVSTGMHACIYTPEIRTQILSEDQQKITDWDLFLNINATRYAYEEPLCFQLFPATENSKHWDNTFGISEFLKWLFNLFGMDESIQGYTFFYLFSKCIIPIILILIFLIAIFLVF
uniref:Glycosyltransferase n=1 Tax=viral metagenome TaxID=1070528 RepID=A0A6C0JSI9_9ZZZZ